MTNSNLYHTPEGKNKVLRRFSMFDGTGSDLTGCSTYDEALEKTGLDYTATVEKLYLGNGQELKNNFAVVKSDDSEHVLGVVGGQYTPVSNRDAFSVAEEIVNEGYGTYEVGGPCLGAKDKVDYSKSFLVLRGEPFYVADDEFDSFTVLNNSFDGSSGVNFQVLAQRLVCLNDMTRYLGGKASQLRINIQHSKTAEDRIRKAKQIVMEQHKNIELIKKEAEAFIGIKYTKVQFQKTVIPAVLKQQKLVVDGQERQRGEERIERVITQLISAYEAEDTQNYNGTAYKVLLALSDWETHAEGLKNTSNAHLYLNRVTKGMLATANIALILAQYGNLNLSRFKG